MCLSFEAGNTVSRALPSLLTQLCCPQVTQASWVAICSLSSTCNSSPSPPWEACSGRKLPSFPWQFYNSELHRLKIFSAFILSSHIFYRHWGLEESEGEVRCERWVPVIISSKDKHYFFKLFHIKSYEGALFIETLRVSTVCLESLDSHYCSEGLWFLYSVFKAMVIIKGVY